MSQPPDRHGKAPRHPARSAPTPRGVHKPLAAGEASAGSSGRYDHPRSLIRSVPDFPHSGVLFKDITPMLADPKAFHIILDGFAEQFIGEHIDVIAGIEARGFVFGGALAARLNASFVPLRKPGKLPGEIDR